jgi:hypothetical protein
MQNNSWGGSCGRKPLAFEGDRLREIFGCSRGHAFYFLSPEFTTRCVAVVTTFSATMLTKAVGIRRSLSIRSVALYGSYGH